MDKVGKVLMQPGRFVGFACDICDPMTFKVLQCNEHPHEHNIVVHRGAVVPLSPAAIGYNSALAPKSDAYFPVGKAESGATIKTAPLEHQGIVDPPDISITEGEGNRRKLSFSPPKSL